MDFFKIGVAALMPIFSHLIVQVPVAPIPAAPVAVEQDLAPAPTYATASVIAVPDDVSTDASTTSEGVAMSQDAPVPTASVAAADNIASAVSGVVGVPVPASSPAVSQQSFQTQNDPLEQSTLFSDAYNELRAFAAKRDGTIFDGVRALVYNTFFAGTQ